MRSNKRAETAICPFVKQSTLQRDRHSFRERRGERSNHLWKGNSQSDTIGRGCCRQIQRGLGHRTWVWFNYSQVPLIIHYVFLLTKNRGFVLRLFFENIDLIIAILHFLQSCINSNKNKIWKGTSLAIQRLRLCVSTASGVGSIPGWGTKFLHAAWGGQNFK